MAKAKKAAKKAVPKVEETKHIILTEEQYDELVSLKWSVNSISNSIKDISTDDDKNVREIAFHFGILQKEVDEIYESLRKITDDIDPNPYIYEEEDEDDDIYN